MPGFLEEGYQADQERREKLFRRVALVLLIVAVLGTAGYFGFRSFPAKRKVSRFLELLRRQDYPAAYQLWGCAKDSPCRDYTFEKFLEDWGPKGAHPDSASAAIKKSRYCGPGVIVTVEFPNSAEAPLWYERRDGNLGFAPWPVCVPQPKGYR